MKKKKNSQGKELFVELRGVESVEFWGVESVEFCVDIYVGTES